MELETEGREESPVVSSQACQLGTLMRFQPELPLRDEFIDSQGKGSVFLSLAPITTGEHGEVPGWGSCL